MPVRKVLKGGKVPVKVWTDDIESEAEKQIVQLSTLPFFFHHIAVMPDVHAGRGSAIGTVTASVRSVIPAAVGVDIGCGMAAVLTPFMEGDLDGKLSLLRAAVEQVIPVGFKQHRTPQERSLAWDGWSRFDDLVPDVHHLRNKAQCQLGTLGGGNHFIEVCLDEMQRVWVMLHSGSRNIGKTLADIHIGIAHQRMKDKRIDIPHRDLSYLDIGTSDCDHYLHDVQWAQAYARENREIMLALILRQVRDVVHGGEPFDVLDRVNCHHNYVAQERHFGREVWVTRKGAIRANEGDRGIIPGSMGARSYIVRGLGNPESFCSASHGAGRRMSRTQAKSVFSVTDLARQTHGVECRKDKGVIDEIPDAYKNIDEVLGNERDLVEPERALKQVICVKG